jgi:3-(3-hydroxy-phenyl)propionate hydroxylase
VRVIIVGAGPVGCTLAMCLAQRDIPVLLIEKEAVLPEDLRASTFHPTSLELLETIGLTDRIIEVGLIAPVYQYRDRESGFHADFDLAVLAGETRYPFRLQCEQFKLTRIAVDLLAAYPHVEVRLGTTVAAIDQDDAGVTVRLRSAAGEETVRGAYVVGCDGVGSVARQSAEIPFEGFTFPEKFLVVASSVDFPRYLDGLASVSYVSDPVEWCALVQVVDSWRVVFPTDPAARDEDLLGDEHVQAQLRRFVPTDGPIEIFHRAVYRVHQRVAATFNAGRVLLAGDAAHANNPLGGMGMNSGIHDAFNLAEKLAAILTQGADAALLDRYTRQRRAAALEYVQAQSMRNKRILEERDPVVRREHLDELYRTATDPVAARAYLRKSAMFDSLELANSIA